MAGTYTPDINQMRASYANALADQQKKSLRGIQDIYAARGTTGGGEEAAAFGEAQNQFGLGAGQAEAQLQQYFGNLGMQQAQLGQQESQFGRNLGEQQRQFNTGQGNWQQQFAENQAMNKSQQDLARASLYGGSMQGGQWAPTQSAQAQQFNQNLSMLPYVYGGMLDQGSAWGGKSPFGQVTTEQQQTYNSPAEQLARQYGFQNTEQMKFIEGQDPSAVRNIAQGGAPGDWWGWNKNYTPPAQQPISPQQQFIKDAMMRKSPWEQYKANNPMMYGG